MGCQHRSDSKKASHGCLGVCVQHDGSPACGFSLIGDEKEEWWFRDVESGLSEPVCGERKRKTKATQVTDSPGLTTSRQFLANNTTTTNRPFGLSAWGGRAEIFAENMQAELGSAWHRGGCL